MVMTTERERQRQREKGWAGSVSLALSGGWGEQTGLLGDPPPPPIYSCLSMTLTLMQSHSGSAAKAKNHRRIISTTKQAIIIKLATMVGHIFYVTLTLKTFIWRDQFVYNLASAEPLAINQLSCSPPPLVMSALFGGGRGGGAPHFWC